MAGSLRVGTCSWKYPSWNGLVYSRASGIDYLAEYASRYDTVEIDQWFWALPEPVTAAQYASVTPDAFRFTIKLPNQLTLTHFHRKPGETDPRRNPDFLSVSFYEQVLERLAPISPKTAVLMLQFEYLNREKLSSRQGFLSRLGRFLDSAPRPVPVAVEPRNPWWLDERYFQFLAERGLGHVFLQGYHMNPIFETWRRYGNLLKDPVVIRLHGPDRVGIERETRERWDAVVAPKDDELDRLAEMLGDLRGRGRTVWLNVNNHYEGSAPRTIERLRARRLFDGDFPRPLRPPQLGLFD